MRILPPSSDLQDLYHTSPRCGRLDLKSYVCDGPLKAMLPKKVMKVLKALVEQS